jgi:hypothetical protein
MARISVICAFLPSRNTGMYTVDLSAYAYFKSTFPEDDVLFYCLGSIDKLGYTKQETHQEYLPLSEHIDAVWNSDMIVYWGDFLHSKPYWETDLAGWLVRDAVSPSRDAAIELIYRAFMLEDAPNEVLRKVVVFGSTIITIGAKELVDRRYATALRRIIAEAGGIYFRDAISAAKASPLRGEQATLGSDCALQLSRHDFVTYSLIDALPQQPGDKLGVFFGRSKWIGQPLALARAVGRKMECETVWLPWLRSAPRQLPLARVFGFPATREPPLPKEILRQLLECQAVITDTYHLCVNAWNLGIPAVCIGFGSQHVGHTLGDKKKEVLYEMYGASAFYIYREHIQTLTAIPATARYAAHILQSPEQIASVQGAIAEHASVARSRLLNACNRVLGRVGA